MKTRQTTVSMLELDRHLGQVFERARQAPISVHRYGHAWAWIVRSDTWADALHWHALDTSGHPLSRLRMLIEPVLQEATWPVPDTIAATVGTMLARRIAVLVELRDIATLRDLHDALTYNILQQRFAGLSAPPAWPCAIAALLLAWASTDENRAVTRAVLKNIAPAIVDAARLRRAISASTTLLDDRSSWAHAFK